MKRALITGITGQDGSYLAELLLDKGYEVHGLVRRSSSSNTARIDHIIDNPNLFLHHGDLTDSSEVTSVLSEVKPDELYNLAAQSHVRASFDIPEFTAQTNAMGTLRLLEAIRSLGLTDKVKFYQASTSELFGNSEKTPQNENTPFYPRSPYGASKLFAYWMTRNYREAYGIFACNGILFNHESERRADSFVTRKITSGLVDIRYGLKESLAIGYLDAKRDWGHAEDYVKAMWMMLQQEKPEDFVISSGESHSVRELIELASDYAGFDIRWEGEGLEEKGIDKKTGKTIIKIDEKYYRPSEVNRLQGDSSLAREILGWEPKIGFKELIRRMIEADLEKVSKASK